MHNESKHKILIENNSGLKWEFWNSAEGWSLGAIYLNGKIVESLNTAGLFFLRNIKTRETIWINGTELDQESTSSIKFRGDKIIDNTCLTFEIEFSLTEKMWAAITNYQYVVDKDLYDWQVCFAYHKDFSHNWTGHIYPFAEDAKVIQEDPLTYVGIPSVLLYRDDFSIAMLYGFALQFDYLNPTSWTGDCGFYFTDSVIPPQFRVGSKGIKKGIDYSWSLNLIFSDTGNWVTSIPELINQWMDLNNYQVESLYVRTPEEALALFINGRHNTSLWNPGMGYQLEEGDPESNFNYLGE